MMLQIPVSPEQEEIIADHLLLGRELGMLPDERAWILSHVAKQAPGSRVVSANLDLENARWLLEIV